jgi:NAD-dependent deacetylase
MNFNTIKKKILIFSGAGLDKESGIDTFRDSDGYWEKYNVMDVASMDGWRKNRELVLDFYNNRKRDFINKKPNLNPSTNTLQPE